MYTLARSLHGDILRPDRIRVNRTVSRIYPTLPHGMAPSSRHGRTRSHPSTTRMSDLAVM